MKTTSTVCFKNLFALSLDKKKPAKWLLQLEVSDERSLNLRAAFASRLMAYENLLKVTLDFFDKKSWQRKSTSHQVPTQIP
jgi:hypothetical protein